MAYTPHALFVMSGTIGTGVDQDIWSVGIRGTFDYSASSGDDGSSWYLASQAWLTLNKPAIQTWFASAAASQRTDASLTRLKMNRIGADGKYQFPAFPSSQAAVASGNVSYTTASFITIAASFKTAIGAGPAANGRIYLPFGATATGVSLDRISSGSTAGYATAVKNLLGILKTPTSAPTVFSFTPSVYSRSGPHSPITGVRVGDVLDVQRRRKNALREVYSPTVAVP